MPPVVAAAAIAGGASIGSGVVASRAQTGATKRSLAASDAAARRAEIATREEDALNRADQARRDAEDKRRWEVEQANLVRRQAQDDERANYEDAIRYGKMVNLARLTGQPIPARPPARSGAPSFVDLDRPPASAPILSRPSSANASIAPPGEFAMSPLTPAQPQRMPISQLVGRRRVI